MNKLNELIKLCKYGVHITINNHRDYYETVDEHFSRIFIDEINDIPVNIYKKMIELNTIVKIQFYPTTPIGSYTIYHYDIDEAINEALNTF